MRVVTKKISSCYNLESKRGYELFHQIGERYEGKKHQRVGIRIVGKTVDEDSFWGSAILLYCENNFGKNVSISAEEMSINGYMMTAYFSSTIYDGKMSMDTITILSSELEENGITSIEEVELRFHIYDADSYSTIADSDYVTFSAE